MLNRIDSSTARTKHPVKRLAWLALASLACALSLTLTQVARAQDDAREQQVLNNIAPVAQVCLANEPCVGQRVDGGEGDAAVLESSPAQTTDASPAQGDAAASEEFDPAAAYQMNCMACHTTGAAGAPEIGDDAAWQERLQKGMDAVMQNAINGIGAMPAMGLCMSCSHEQLREIVDYMLDQ